MLQEFFAQLLPDGLVVIVRRHGKNVRQIVCENLDDAMAEVAMARLEDDVDCYFGLASLNSPYVIVDGKKKFRCASNIRALKSFFIDIDVDPFDDSKYPSQNEAVKDLMQFCKRFGFPKPLIVSSGSGLHVYWPLEKEVAADRWRTMAKLFKTILITYELRIDPTRTADASSILRVPGTINTKNGQKVEILMECPSYSGKRIVQAIVYAAQELGAESSATLQQKPAEIPGLGNNTKIEYPPANFREILKECKQVQALAKTGGESEPLWYAGIGLASHTTEPEKAAKFISRNYPGYTETETMAKLSSFRSSGAGPTTCARFDEHNPNICNKCQYFGKITSPIQLGSKLVPAAPPPVVQDDESFDETVIELPNPPYPYIRSEKGEIFIEEQDSRSEKKKLTQIYGRDFYPTKIMHSEVDGVAYSQWKTIIPNEGSVFLEIPQSLMANQQKLHEHLLSKHVPIMPGKMKYMASYMVAYIKQLQEQTSMERQIGRLGWRNDNTEFALGNKIYTNTGKIITHAASAKMSEELRGLKQNGSLQGWIDTMQFYNVSGHEAHRFALYAAFGSTLFHMTGHKGALIFLTGKPGFGKTTVLRAINSIYGHPIDMEINGTRAGTTEVAVYALFCAYNNIPICLDDMTNFSPVSFGNIALSISQGVGKRRGTKTGELAKQLDTWAFLAFASANTDAYAMLSKQRGDSSAEAMRIFQIKMLLPTKYSKTEADHFANVQLLEHYGLAGHTYTQHIVPNYDKIKAHVLKSVERVNAAARIRSSERFWSAIVGVAATSGILARKLGLLADFPVEHDLSWAIEQIDRTRSQVSDHSLAPHEILAEYLESRIGETLILTQTRSVTPRIEQEPRGSLTIRHEKDQHRAFIMRSQFRQFCSGAGYNVNDVESALIEDNIIENKCTYKVLGAGTNLAKGQTRCWLIDMYALNRKRREDAK